MSDPGGKVLTMDLGDERMGQEFERIQLHNALEREDDLVKSYFIGMQALINRVDKAARRIGELDHILRSGQ